MRNRPIFFLLITVLFASLMSPHPLSAQGAMSAADLRVALTSLLGEHVLLASAATNAALHGNDPEFQAAAAALDRNSVAIANAIGMVYGRAAGDAFLPLWRKHIDFFVDYTVGVATNDMQRQNQAVADLDVYRQDFGAFLASANPNLTKDAVAEALVPHVMHLASTVNAQAKKDYASAYAEIRKAYAHASDLALVLAGAIAKQFPDRFSGMVDSPAAGLRVLLTNQLGEHTVLAAMATNAALQGRTNEFEAAAMALDNNSMDIAQSVATVYGKAAGDAFLPLWRSHIAFFVDYTMGVAAGDKAKQDKAVADLNAYRNDFGAFLAGANPFLTKDTVAEALVPHVMHLASVVNAQAKSDYVTAYNELMMGYAHAGELGGVLAGAIAQQFPDKFMAQSMPMAMPATGHAEHHEATHLIEAHIEGWVVVRGVLGVLLLSAALFYLRRRKETVIAS